MRKVFVVVFNINLGSWLATIADSRLVRRFKICAILMVVSCALYAYWGLAAFLGTVTVQ